MYTTISEVITYAELYSRLREEIFGMEDIFSKICYKNDSLIELLVCLGYLCK